MPYGYDYSLLNRYGTGAPSNVQGFSLVSGPGSYSQRTAGDFSVGGEYASLPAMSGGGTGGNILGIISALLPLLQGLSQAGGAAAAGGQEPTIQQQLFRLHFGNPNQLPIEVPDSDAFLAALLGQER